MNGEATVTDSDEDLSKRKSRCFSNLLRGKKVGCFTVNENISGECNNEIFKRTESISDTELDNSIPDSFEEKINGGSRITNVALCCAITETTKTPITFKCIGHSKFSADSYQPYNKTKANKMENKPDSHESNVKNEVENKTRSNFEHLVSHSSNPNLNTVDSLCNLKTLDTVSQIATKDKKISKDCVQLSENKRPSLRSSRQRRPKSLSELPRRSSSLDSKSSSSVDSSLESLIKHSISAAKALHPVPISKAKKRNYLHGRSGAVSLLGTTELERVFPDREVRIYIATWNMNGEDPPSDLSELFLPEMLETLPDIYAIGTQESFSDTSEWEVAIQETIGPSHVLFHSETLGTIYLGIFIRRELIWFCSEPEDTSFSVRPGSAFKTKGAVGVCFYLFGTSLLFVSSHLTAHDDRVQDRINDVKRICKSLELPKELPIRHRNKDVTQNFDYVFWFGDLNFRLTQPRAQVIDWLSNQKFPLESPLQSPLYDQLSSSMRKGLVFRGFQESPLTFKPTYKYDPGTQNFDTSHKQRVPSYTDRILFKMKKSSSILMPINTNNYNVRCLTYTSVPSFCTSDHKPVWGLFTCKIRPGSDIIPLAAGLFNREVYLDGLKRRAQSRRLSSDSSVCIIQ